METHTSGSTVTVEADSESSYNLNSTDTIAGLKLTAIIGKIKGRCFTYPNGRTIEKTGDRINDDDRYEIEGILQDYSTGWVTLNSAYRTDSRSISSLRKTKEGEYLYVSTAPLEAGARLHDPQGFYRELSEWGYSLIDSRIEMTNSSPVSRK